MTSKKKKKKNHKREQMKKKKKKYWTSLPSKSKEKIKKKKRKKEEAGNVKKKKKMACSIQEGKKCVKKSKVDEARNCAWAFLSKNDAQFLLTFFSSFWRKNFLVSSGRKHLDPTIYFLFSPPN